jgi:hypothetical protein
VDSNNITVLVSGEQKHYFHLWGLQKPLVIYSVPTRENNVFLLSFHRTVILHYCLTGQDSHDIIAQVSGEQKQYFHLWRLQKSPDLGKIILKVI